jgi:hypothetical protein
LLLYLEPLAPKVRVTYLNDHIATFDAISYTGSAVVDALLADKTFTPRAVTRNASSEAAKHLASRGAEVVVADLWDKESIKHALTGSECVFGVGNISCSVVMMSILMRAAQVTNYYDPSIAGSQVKGEVDQGKILIDAAKEVGVKFFVWRFVGPASMTDENIDIQVVVSLIQQICRKGNTLVSIISTVSIHKPLLIAVTPMRLSVDKAEVEEYLKQSGLPSATVYTGLFSYSKYVGPVLILYRPYCCQVGSARTCGSKYSPPITFKKILTHLQGLAVLQKLTTEHTSLSFPVIALPPPTLFYGFRRTWVPALWGCSKITKIAETRY